MAHIPVEPDPVAVAAIAPAEPEPAPAPTAKVSCFNREIKIHVYGIRQTANVS